MLHLKCYYTGSFCKDLMFENYVDHFSQLVHVSVCVLQSEVGVLHW